MKILQDGIKNSLLKRCPITLLLLSSPRCLGRGYTFVDLEEQIGTVGETHRVFS